MSDNEDDLYADLYGGAEQTAAPEESAAPAATGAADSSKPAEDVGGGSSASARPAAPAQDDHGPAAGRDPRHGGSASPAPASAPSRPSEKPLPPPGTRADVPPAARLDDGKMFIGGLNWDTTDDGLSDYFSQFGRVLSCTVMRDPSSGRSRGFAFLTFEDPASVNDVMIREHFLDGKAIDPKRAIPRNEERSTDKLFVRNIPPGVTQPMLQDYFGKFGMLTDCTLMMDRDTRQHRGFGFVTFKDEVTVDRVVNNQPYTIFGQQIEVKRSAPRRGEEGGGFRGGRGRGGGGGYSAFNHSNSGGGGGGYGNSAGGGMMGGAGANPMMGGMGMGMNPMGMMGGFDPSAMAEYFKNMGWGQWNPAMMMNPMMNPMMGGAGAGAGASGGMMMPGMPAASSPVPGSSGSHGGGGGGGGRGGEAKSLSPPPNAPTGPKGGSSSGPVRNNPGGRGYHPYSR